MADCSSMSENQACSWCRENCQRIHGTRASATSAAPLSFYKIVTECMLTGNPSAYMQLPTSFVRRCNDALGPVTLKGPCGQEWKVELSGTRDDSIGFRNGWTDFCSYQNLTKGDILFFWRTAESCFYVFIFDKNGCEKNPASVMSDMPGSKSESLPNKWNGLEVQSCEDAKSLKKSSKTEIQARHDNVCLKRLRSDNHEKEKATQCNNAAMDITIKEEAVHKELEDNAMSSTKAGLFHASKPESFGRDMYEPSSMCVVDMLPAGRQNILSAEVSNSEESQHNNELKNSADIKQNMQELWGREENIQSSSLKYPRHDNRRKTISQRRAVTEEERQKALQEAQAYKSRRPFATVVMKRSYVCQGCKLNLPAAFVKKWFPADSAQVILLNSKGEKFLVKWLGSKRCPNAGISGGWHGFVRANGIEEDDVCVFELRRKNPLLFRVFIYRVCECDGRVEAQVSSEISSLASVKHIAEKSGTHLKMKSGQVVKTEDSVKFQSKRGQSSDRANPRSVQGVIPQIDNKTKQIGYETSVKVSVSCSGAKEKVKHMANESENTVISPEQSISDDSAHLKIALYNVESVIGRRVSKSSKTTEFLVQLENTQDLVEIKNFEKEGTGAWWVPFSHFTEDLMTCCNKPREVFQPFMAML